MSSEPVEVKIGHHDVFLVLSDNDAKRGPHGELESMTARLELPKLSAEGSVWMSGGEPALAEFFGDMADHPRGWDGELKWNSLEGGLYLACTSDALGHIAIRVELWESSQHGWVVKGEVPVDAGQLGTIAVQLRQLFR